VRNAARRVVFAYRSNPVVASVNCFIPQSSAPIHPAKYYITVIADGFCRASLVAHQRIIKQSVVLEGVASAPRHFPTSPAQNGPWRPTPRIVFTLTPHSLCRMSTTSKTNREQAFRRIQIRRGISIAIVALGPLLILAAVAVTIVLAFIRSYRW
jgi:hypothetical protein